jgi:hypothetical protein
MICRETGGREGRMGNEKTGLERLIDESIAFRTLERTLQLQLEDLAAQLAQRRKRDRARARTGRDPEEARIAPESEGRSGGD